jgi:hypothetical protein
MAIRFFTVRLLPSSAKNASIQYDRQASIDVSRGV